eukprot:s6715_g1.t1
MDWKMKRLLQKVHKRRMAVPYPSLAAAATHQWCSPATNWSLRIRTVLAGSALASIKLPPPIGKLRLHGNGEEQRRSLCIARIVAVISRGQAERESWVIQAWARLASLLDLVDVRSQGCGHKMEDVVRQWPRMADMLLAHDASTGWRAGVIRARLLNCVLGRWRRLTHLAHGVAVHAEEVSGHRKAEITWKWGRTAILLLYWQAIGDQQDATDVTEAFYRASMSWARLVKKMHHAQAEREHKVVQSWA